MNDELKLRYTETFYSPQGEGAYTGIPSLWMRFFLCNLECRGFGQKDPTDRTTYKEVGNDLDLTDITDFHQLPVFDVGCDSAYSVSKRYRHLITDRTVVEAVDELTALLPTGTFVHSATQQNIDMVFTGGEPMLKNTQPGMVAVINEFHRRGNMPHRITVETNGTKPIEDCLVDLIENIHMSSEWGGMCDDHSHVQPEWFWSVSPKLWNTAGEKHKKAICPDVVAGYAQESNHGQLKYVVNGTEASWLEVEENTRLYRAAGVDWPVYIMGVGGTVEGLRMTEAMIADEAIQRGYFYTSRMHNHIWGNAIGK